jgi:hypothetical protein
MGETAPKVLRVKSLVLVCGSHAIPLVDSFGNRDIQKVTWRISPNWP